MKAKASECCVVVNRYCTAHRRRATKDNGAICGARKSWEATQCTCWVCATLVVRESAMNLHGKYHKFLRKEKLELGFVKDLSQEDRVHWTLVNQCPEDQAICSECVTRTEKILNGSKVCTRMPEYDFELVPVFKFLIPRKIEEVVEESTAPADNSELIEAVKTIADKILGRRGISYADKEPEYGGRGTQCIVAANNAEACNNWDHWGRMLTLTMPSIDGSPGRAHFGFCPTCRDILVIAGYKLGPSLYECIVGKKPMFDNVVSIGTPFANAAAEKKRGRSIAEQKAHKAARGAAQKAAYPPGQQRSNDSVGSSKKKGKGKK